MKQIGDTYRFQQGMPTLVAFPRAVVVDGDGALYVGGCMGHRNGGLQKFQRTVDGRFTSCWYEETGRLTDVALAPDGTVCVTVKGPDHTGIREFNPNGTLLRDWGRLSSEHGCFMNPQGLAIDCEGLTYVVETRYWDGDRLHGANRVQCFYADKLLRVWNAHPDDVAFNLPMGISLTHGHAPVVADTYNCRVTRLPINATAVTWGEYGQEAGQLNCPQDLAVDRYGRVFVADTYNNRIQVFDDGGAYILAWGSQGDGAGEFWLPCGIALDQNGAVYIADTLNRRVQVFVPGE